LRAPPGRGLPIGNLNSQFFANVYLNALDQFAKHVLKVRWYLRYCDDFVLLADSPGQLLTWREQLREFLDARLGLQLNDMRERLCPVADGVDFLGYIVRPFHLLVRRRVVGHLRERLFRGRKALVREGPIVTTWRFDAVALDTLQAALASYIGHFRWAAHRRLLVAMWRDNPWLGQFFTTDATLTRLQRRDRPPVDARNVLGQYAHWCRQFPDDELWIQVGAFVERLRWPPRRREAHRKPRDGGGRRRSDALKRMGATRRGALEGFPLPQLARRLAARLTQGRSVLLVAQTQALDHRLVQRRPVRRWVMTSSQSEAAGGTDVVTMASPVREPPVATPRRYRPDHSTDA